MSINPQRIKELLGQGLNAETVASAVGCEPSYISQLVSNEEFANDVAELRSQALLANNKRDTSIDGIEDKLISKLTDVIDANGFYKPADLLHAFRIVNSAKRRGHVVNTAQRNHTTVVNLQIPMAVAQKFIVNSSNEVVQVGEQTLVTMSPRGLLDAVTANTRNEDDAARFNKIRGYLPSTAAGEKSG